MRLINAAYLFRCETCRSNSSGGCDTWCEHGESYRPDIKKIPTINPEELRLKGEWILKDGKGNGVCNHCNRQDKIDPLATHCRYCGAKMGNLTNENK